MNKVPKLTENEQKSKQITSLTRLVICTRPRVQNISWQKCLVEAGFNSVALPLLEIKALTDFSQIQKIKQITLNLDHYQKVIFVSQNAVRFGLDCIENYWPECPIGISWLAVGSKTAEVLKVGLEQRFNCFNNVNGISETDITTAEGAMNSESLLAMPELSCVNQEKILIARGLGGRPHLVEVLTERGAIVDLWELYERGLPDNLLEDYLRFFAQYKDYDISCLVFSVFSGETLENLDRLFIDLLNTNLVSNRDKYREFKNILDTIKIKSWVLVPGDRVKKIAKNKGFRNIVCAENASEKSMVSALKNHLG